MDITNSHKSNICDSKVICKLRTVYTTLYLSDWPQYKGVEKQ